MASIDELTDDIALMLPDATRATIRDAIRWAERQLAQKGAVYRITDEPIVVAARSQYPEIEAPRGTEPVAILRLIDDGRELTPNIHYRQSGPTSIEFRSTPSANVLYGVLAVSPKPGGDLPGDVFTRYYDALNNGALSRLYLIPGQPWTDQQMAVVHTRQFRADQANAHRDSVSGLQGGAARVAIPSFV